MDYYVDIDAEQAVLSAILIDNHTINEIRDLQPTDFYKSDHRVIWSTIVSMYDRGIDVDIITLADELKKDGCLAKMGGSYYIIQMADKIPSAANIAFHANIVREKALVRKAIMASKHFSEFDPAKTVQEWLASYKLEVDSIGSVNRQKLVHIEEPITENDNEEAYKALSQTQFRTSWDVFDRNVLLKRTDLILLAGATSSGKTAFALSKAKKLAKNEYKVGFCSIEMPNNQLLYRLAHSESLIEGFPGYKAGLEKLINLPVWLYDAPNQSIETLMSVIDEGIRKHKTEIFFIDYLQLMALPEANTVHHSIAALSCGLKNAAKKYNIPIIALAQLSRAFSSRAYKRPVLQDLKESGNLEQDADTVLFTYRPYTFKENKDKAEFTKDFGLTSDTEMNFFMLLVAKQRGYKTCDIPFHFNPTNQAFHLWDSYHTKPF